MLDSSTLPQDTWTHVNDAWQRSLHRSDHHEPVTRPQAASMHIAENETMPALLDGVSTACIRSAAAHLDAVMKASTLWVGEEARRWRAMQRQIDDAAAASKAAAGRIRSESCTREPIVLTSRADPRRTRLASCAIALLLAERYRATPP